MSSKEWKRYIFSDFVIINPPVKLDKSMEYSYVEMKDLNESSKFAYPSVKRKLSGGSRFQNNDTLFARITPCLENGKICQVKRLDNNVGFGSTEFFVFRGNEDISDNDFVFYLSRYDEVRNYAVQNMLGTSGRQRVPREAFDSLEIDVPPLSTQRRIADILSALDEKIELNRQTNATLEAIAQCIFREWFVEFNFPGATGEMVESELGLIPQGWRVGTIGEIATVIDCLHSKKPERQDYGKIFLQLNNIRDDGLIDLSDVFYISDNDYQKWVSRIEASEGDCIITNVGRVGAAAQIPPGLHAALGRNMTAIRCKAEYPFPTFLISCLLSDFMREEISYKTDSGTILDALNVKNIPLLRFALAPKPILTAFEKTVRPFREQMETNLSQSHVLANIRDLLLPKLMSGEIEITNN